jgi:Na+-translocating ferredoxin:NAD+ oxidoreductase RnfG subunit
MPNRAPHFRRLGIMLGLALLAGVESPALAERFLTVEEAQGILFPKAKKFDGQVVRFTAKEKKAIIEVLGNKFPNAGNRIWTATSGETLHGVMIVDYVLGKHLLIDYAVAISPQGKVLGVEILEYRESYGGEIRQEKWRKQFLGKTSESDLQLHDGIYNISGATLSCRHVTDGVRRVLATFEVVLRARLAGDHPSLSKPAAK